MFHKSKVISFELPYWNVDLLVSFMNYDIECQLEHLWVQGYLEFQMYVIMVVGYGWWRLGVFWSLGNNKVMQYYGLYQFSLYTGAQGPNRQSITRDQEFLVSGVWVFFGLLAILWAYQFFLYMGPKAQQETKGSFLSL